MRYGDTQMVGAGRTRWHEWWPLVLLCLVAASRWLLADPRPDTASTIATKAAGCGLAALVVFGVSLLRRSAAAEGGAAMWRAALAGALLLAGPLVGLFLDARSVEGTDWMIAFALAPVVAAVALPAFGAGMSGVAGRMWPGLASVAGLLLIFPQPALGDVRGDVAMVLAPLLMGIGAAMFCTGDPAPDGARGGSRVVSALSGAALLFSVVLLARLVQHGWRVEFSPVAAVLDAVEAWLGITVLSRLGTMRWTAQFSIVPLAVMFAGMVGLHVGFDWRRAGGMGLLFVASVFLLLPPEEDEADEASALNLG